MPESIFLPLREGVIEGLYDGVNIRNKAVIPNGYYPDRFGVWENRDDWIWKALQIEKQFLQNGNFEILQHDIYSHFEPLEIGSRIFGNEVKWAEGYISHYVLKHKVIPSFELYTYVQNFDI